MLLLDNFLGLFLHNYQQELKMIKGSDFVFESADQLDYKLHKLQSTFKERWIIYKISHNGYCIKEQQ